MPTEAHPHCRKGRTSGRPGRRRQSPYLHRLSDGSAHSWSPSLKDVSNSAPARRPSISSVTPQKWTEPASAFDVARPAGATRPWCSKVQTDASNGCELAAGGRVALLRRGQRAPSTYLPSPGARKEGSPSPSPSLCARHIIGQTGSALPCDACRVAKLKDASYDSPGHCDLPLPCPENVVALIRTPTCSGSRIDWCVTFLTSALCGWHVRSGKGEKWSRGHRCHAYRPCQGAPMWKIRGFAVLARSPFSLPGSLAAGPHEPPTTTPTASHPISGSLLPGTDHSAFAIPQSLSRSTATWQHGTWQAEGLRHGMPLPSWVAPPRG